MEMELAVEPEAEARGSRLCRCCRRLPSSVWWALAVVLLLAVLVPVVALWLAGKPPFPPGTNRSSHIAGARLVLDGPGKILKPGKLEWYADNRMEGVRLGPGFEYNPTSHKLKIKNPGSYSVCAQLSVIHHFKSSSEENGTVTLTIHHETAHNSAPILTLTVHLSSPANETLNASMAVSPRLLEEGDSLYVILTVSNTAADGHRSSTQWYFDDGTAFSLSLISG